jgi:hypothetical protein
MMLLFWFLYYSHFIYRCAKIKKTKFRRQRVNTVRYKHHGCEFSSEGYYSYQFRENQSNYAKVEMMGHAQARTETLADIVTAYDMKSQLTSH